MPWRFRKSLRVLPGVRVNLSKRGVGYSVGGRGFRYTVGADGRRTRTVGIPGTGISYVETQAAPRRSSPPAWRAPIYAPAPPVAYGCPTCRRPLVAGRARCLYCGAFYADAPGESPPAPAPPAVPMDLEVRRNWIILGVVLTLGLLLYGGSVLFASFPLH